MFKLLRKKNPFSTFMALFFIGLLVIAFGFWGIGDIFRAKPKNTIATVGDLDIAKDLLSIEFQRKMGSYKGQLNQTFDKRMLRGAILNEILREYALIYKIKNLKITTPKEYVAKKIAITKQFKDSENNFNKDIFLETLRANGYTEKSFTEKIKNAASAEQLEKVAVVDNSLPNIFSITLRKFYSQERDIKYFIVDAKDFVEKEIPNNQDLLDFYEANKELFTLPEMRSFSYLEISPKMISELVIKDGEISDKKIWDFIDQIQDMRDSGTSIEDLAKKFNFNIKNTELITRDRQDTNSLTVTLPEGFNDMEESFSMEINSESQINDYVDGTIFFYKVSEVVDKRVKTFDEALSDIDSNFQEKLNQQNIQNTIDDFYKKISSGETTFEEFANEKNFNISTKNKTNVLMEKVEPLNQELIQKIFNTPLNETTYANINDKNLFLFAKIENITENDSLKKDEKILNLIKQINNDYLSLLQATFSDSILSNVKVSINEAMIDNFLKN